MKVIALVDNDLDVRFDKSLNITSICQNKSDEEQVNIYLLGCYDFSVRCFIDIKIVNPYVYAYNALHLCMSSSSKVPPDCKMEIMWLRLVGFYLSLRFQCSIMHY